MICLSHVECVIIPTLNILLLLQKGTSYIFKVFLCCILFVARCPVNKCCNKLTLCNKNHIVYTTFAVLTRLALINLNSIKEGMCTTAFINDYMYCNMLSNVDNSNLISGSQTRAQGSGWYGEEATGRRQ